MLLLQRPQLWFERHDGLLKEFMKHFFVLSVLLAIFSLSQAQTSESEIQAGVAYKALSRVYSSWTGVSLQIPTDYQGGVQNASTFLMRQTSGSSAVLAVAQVGANLSDIAAFLNSPQDVGNGVLVNPNSSAKIQKNRVSQRYQANGYMALVLSVMGSNENGITFYYFGSSNLEATGQKLLETLANSVRFTKPQALEVLTWWNQNLRGKQLYLFDYKTTGNAQTGTDTTREATWQLCSNNQYTYQGNVQTSLNVSVRDPYDSSIERTGLNNAGLNASSHTGRWKAVMLGAAPTLMLIGTDGFVRGHALWINGQNLLVDGMKVQVSSSKQCN